MNPSKVLAVWMHLGPAQLIDVFVPPETDCQLDLCFLAGVISGQTPAQIRPSPLDAPTGDADVLHEVQRFGNADDDTTILTGGSEDEGSAAAAASPD